jgi:hypothetical protein
MRIVLTTITRITASMTAYSAMFCPLSSLKIWGRILIFCTSFQAQECGLLGWKPTNAPQNTGRGEFSGLIFLIRFLPRLCSPVREVSIQNAALQNRLPKRDPVDFNTIGA